MKKLFISIPIVVCVFNLIIFDASNELNLPTNVREMKDTFSLNFEKGDCTMNTSISIINNRNDVYVCDIDLPIDYDEISLRIKISKDSKFKEYTLKEKLHHYKKENPLVEETWTFHDITLHVDQFSYTNLEMSYIPFYKIDFTYNQYVYEISIHFDSKKL